MALRCRKKNQLRTIKLHQHQTFLQKYNNTELNEKNLKTETHKIKKELHHRYVRRVTTNSLILFT